MTQNQTGFSALQKVALVNVDLSIWSGYKRTTEKELIAVGAALPKDSPLTNGGKKIFPTEFLAEFSQIRKEVSRKLASIGVAALGGSARAVPETEVDGINGYLQDVLSRFQAAVSNFDGNYDVRMSDYLASINADPVRDIIDKAKLERADAVSKFGMKWQVFKIVPTGDTEESSRSLVSGMATSLFEEVAKSAKEIYEKSFIGKPRVTQKALHQVRGLRNKMEGLSFLNQDDIDPIVKSVDETLNLLPQEGWIEGMHLSLLTSVILKMTNPDQMLEHAKLIAAGKSTAEALGINISNDDALLVVQPAAQQTVEVAEPQTETEPVLVTDTVEVEVQVVEVASNVDVPVQKVPADEAEPEVTVEENAPVIEIEPVPVAAPAVATPQKPQVREKAAFF
jgi:hypothetical protein